MHTLDSWPTVVKRSRNQVSATQMSAQAIQLRIQPRFDS